MSMDLKILLVFVLYILVSVKFSIAFDDFFIVNKYFGAKFYCITNSSFALSWIIDDTTTQNSNFQQESKFLPVSHKFWTLECADFTEHQWQCANTISKEIIWDRRWEGIEIYKTDYSELKGQVDFPLTFTTLDEIFPENFQTALSIRTNQEAHIFLCDGTDVTNSNCYWLILQGFGGLTSGIRKCPVKTIPSRNSRAPKEPCKSLKSTIQHSSNNPKFLSPNKWNHFILARNQTRLSFKKSTGEEILSYDDTENNPFHPKRIILHSKQTTGLWKLHKVKYFVTTQTKRTVFSKPIDAFHNSICLSMFITMCEKCKMILEMTDVDDVNKTVKQKSYSSEQEKRWSEIKFCQHNATTRQVLFAVTTMNENGALSQYWAISDIKQRQKDGFRMIYINDMANCQLMAPNTEVISLDNQISLSSSSEFSFNHCIEETIGRYCIPCGSFLNGKCEELKICEKYSNQFQCSCSAGYQVDNSKKNCITSCSDGTYGHECTKQCSKYCINCNHITGTCGTCRDDYKGRKCDIPPVPTFNHPPSVTASYTEASIRVENFDLSTSPSTAESYNTYTIQHKEADIGNQVWITYPENYRLGEKRSITITNLKSGTKYVVRSVITTTKYDESNEIPVTKFTTKCDDIESEDLVIELSQTTANFTVLPERRQYLCTFNPSHPKVQPGINLHDLSYPEPFEIHLKNLKPFEKYTLNVNIGNKEITQSFKTIEGIPDKVQNLNGEPISTTAIELNWEPGKIYGNLEHYIVKYQLTQYLACESGTLTYESEITTTATTASLTLSNLNPYTKYFFSVAAKNTKYTGDWQTIFVDTSQSETISNDEIPELESRKNQARSVLLKFSETHCSKLRGPIAIMITIQCSEKWCKKENTKEIEHSAGKPISVLPFTNYVFIIKFCRNKIICSPNTKQETFRSDVDTPYTVSHLSVYSKNNSSISVRWQPPYPPSGIVELYNIQSLNSLNLRKDFGNVSNSPCRLWLDFQCFTMSSLSAGRRYSVELRAKNKKPDRFGLLTATEAITVTEQSEPPPELNIFWTLENDLKIKWKHPTEANGDISSFKISVLHSGSVGTLQIYETLSATKDQYRSEYEYVVPASKLLTSTKYKITVKAYNNLDGKEAVLTESSPPEIPIFEKEPALQITNHSIEIETYKINNFSSRNNYKLFLLLLDEEAGTVSQPVELQQLQETFNIKLSKFRSLYECSSYENMEKFVIGENTNNSTTNCKSGPRLGLTPGTHYNVTILLVNTHLNKSSYKFYTYDLYTAGQTPEEPKDLTLLLLLLLLLLIPIAIIIFFKRRPITEKLTSVKKNICGPTSNDTETPEEETPLSTVPIIPKRTKKVHSKKVKISDLEQYVKESLKSGELERQHKLFLRGQTKPWECGALNENKSKNRYANLIAYDHSRVVLNQSKTDLHSDYINASYIDGYQIRKAYIATQGPKVSTTTDFWKMIWQENVHHIAMLANVYEGGKKKVEKYWPDTNETLIFENISVQHISNKVHADYEHRIFQVLHHEESREIHQYHFSSWPDHGVPLYSQSLVPFLETLQNVPLSSQSPIVVHCSAGVGRTGTILLCDICLRMAAKEKAVDMLKFLQKLRDQRPNMVDNYQQYKLAHLVILEYLLGMKTGIQCGEIRSEVKTLLENGEVGNQLSYLENTAWQDQTMKSVVTKKDLFIVKEKNRFQEIVPEIQGYIFLSRYPFTDESSTYINAVNVDGFQNPNRFIVTQQPMPNTLGDFWRLIHEKDVSVIISLNEINLTDKTSCVFWPSQSEDLKPVEYITLRHVNTLSLSFYDLISVEMYISDNDSDEIQTVEILEFKNWPAQTDCPKNLEAFMSFYEESNVAARQSKPVIVTCFDGALASGLYVALSFVIEKIKLEQICDVCQAVRNIRHNRSQFVRNAEQFEFLYRAAVAYIDGFQSYANFN